MNRLCLCLFQEQQEENTYYACMQELLKQNGELQNNLRRLEKQHYDLQLRTINQHDTVSRSLDMLEDLQHKCAMHLWQKQFSVQRAFDGGVPFGGVVGTGQQDVFRQLGHPEVFGVQRAPEPGVSFGGVLSGVQQSFARQPAAPLQAFVPRDPMIEGQSARQLVVQHQQQTGLREEQVRLQNGVYDYSHGLLMDRYWRNA